MHYCNHYAPVLLSFQYNSLSLLYPQGAYPSRFSYPRSLIYRNTYAILLSNHNDLAHKLDCSISFTFLIKLLGAEQDRLLLSADGYHMMHHIMHHDGLNSMSKASVETSGTSALVGCTSFGIRKPILSQYSRSSCHAWYDPLTLNLVDKMLYNPSI